MLYFGSPVDGWGEAWAEPGRSKGDARCWMGGRALFMSGILLSEGEPKVCAKEGRDWGGWVAMSPWGLDMDTGREDQQDEGGSESPLAR